ncbi:MAG: methyltransferase domain-containing protein [Deltaproteobacteria bacterium]|nr:methyltransferase domain-containing protein [Deltaproteobacteria bacterium]MBN2674697.1 methyltransferase domain-containing protein [Deltaproteobacteria bacterium]
MYKKNYPENALQAKFEAQKIAFAPMVFQAAKALLDFGILAFLDQAENGATTKDISEAVGLSDYAVETLLEAGLAARILYLDDTDTYCLTRVGYFLIRDELTRVNMNFVHDVCYQGMFHLQTALRENRPAGLDHFGDWKTIYDALANLPLNARKSWFEFDHFYSDIAFNLLLPIVFESNPLIVMDIGANTGKWTAKCLSYREDVHLIAVDLPGQLHVAAKNIDDAGFAERVTYLPQNVLGEDSLGQGVDVIWMSQFLCCFSPEQIVHIFNKAKAALHENGSIFVLETFWNTQRFEASAFSLINTSLYFTAMANGNSKMYHSDVLLQCAEEAGLTCVSQRDDIGIAHTLLELTHRSTK